MIRTPLFMIATARSGDKGDTSNIALFVRDPAHWPAVLEQLTAARVAAAWPALVRGPVTRHVLAHLHCMNFVLEQALEGGVNASLNLDAHGKSFSQLLLGLTVDLPGTTTQPTDTTHEGGP